MKTPTVPLGSFLKIEKGKKAACVFERPTVPRQRYLQIDDLRPDAKPKFVEPFHCPRATIEDVILAWDGANAGTVSCNLEGLIGSTLAVLRFDVRKLHPAYLSRFLEAQFDYLQANATGATVPHISRGSLERLELPLPDIARQGEIAVKLGQADQLRRTRRYALELGDTFLQSLLLRMFGDIRSNSKGWDVEPFGDSLEAIEAGVSFAPVADNESASPWRVLKVSAVTSGEFRPDESKPISPSIKPANKLIVRRGDFLMSRANTVELVGAVCRVRLNPPMVLLPDKLWRIKFSEGSKLDPDYLLILLQTPEMRHRIGLVATGTSGSMKNITQDDAMSLLLPTPPLPLQQRFAAIVARHERLRARHREALRQADHLFQTLLHRAFAGT